MTSKLSDPARAVPRADAGRVWFPALDGLRAVAALVVIVFHTTGSVAGYPAWYDGGVLARLGNWGVAIFFLLSGFLLYRPMVANWFGGRSIGAYGPYLVRRLVRIIPAYWVALTYLLFVVRHTAPKGGWAAYALFYGFAQNYRTGYVDRQGLSVAWTLCIEMSFYLVLPLLALGLCQVSPRRWALARRVRAQVAVIGVVSVLAVWLRYWLISAHPLQSFWLPAYLGWFGLGMMGAVWHAGGAAGNPIPAAMRVLGRFPELSWLFGLQVFWLTTLIKPSAFIQTRAELMWIFIGNGVSAALLLAPLVFGDQSRGWLRAGLSRFPVRWLGEISYGTYLWHTIWLAVVLGWIKGGHVSSEYWVRFGLVVVMTLATAQLSLTLLERPLMNLIRRRPRNPETTTVVTGAA